jgi:hypothetical protein
MGAGLRRLLDQHRRAPARQGGRPLTERASFMLIE